MEEGNNQSQNKRKQSADSSKPYDNTSNKKHIQKKNKGENKSEKNNDVALGDKNTCNLPIYLRIIHIDVAQGESTLIIFGFTEQEIDYPVFTALIDGGRAQYVRHIKETMSSYGITKLSAIINTHYDADHIEGLTSYLNDSIKIKEEKEKEKEEEKKEEKKEGKEKVNCKYLNDNIYIIYRGVDSSDDKFQLFKKAAKSFGHFIPIDEVDDVIVNSKSSFAEIIKKSKFTFKCISANSDDSNKSLITKDENANSLGFLIGLGKFKYYTAGDLPSRIEDQLIGVDSITAFKCGHHGSKHSTSAKPFLDNAQPKVAFISSGKHSYCHPDEPVLNRLVGCDSIKKIYLTNCCYNRTQVNYNYIEDEINLIDNAYMYELDKHLSALDRQNIAEKDKNILAKLITIKDEARESAYDITDKDSDAFKSYFESIIKMFEMLVDDANKDITSKIEGKMEEDTNDDAEEDEDEKDAPYSRPLKRNLEKFKYTYKLLKAIYKAAIQFDEYDSEAELKAVVSGGVDYLGNIELYTNGNDWFRVGYVSIINEDGEDGEDGEDEVVWDYYNLDGSELELDDISDNPEEILVARSEKTSEVYTAPFSLPTLSTGGKNEKCNYPIGEYFNEEKQKNVAIYCDKTPTILSCGFCTVRYCENHAAGVQDYELLGKPDENGKCSFCNKPDVTGELAEKKYEEENQKEEDKDSDFSGCDD